ncbi:MAG: hypothetical protein QW597_05295 [Thermoplasmataceae archaeon]
MIDQTKITALREIFKGEEMSTITAILENYERYESDINELLSLYYDHRNLSAELSSLQTKYSALNIELYDLYMAVHSNAIVISAKIAESNLMNKGIKESLMVELQDILDEYLIFKGFR